MSEFDYKITNQVYDLIITGNKSIEVRLYNDKASKIKIDDIINFKVIDNDCLGIKVKVIGLLIYKNIDSLLKIVDIKNIFNGSKSQLNEMLNNIYGIEKVKSHHIIGIEFEIIED